MLKWAVSSKRGEPQTGRLSLDAGVTKPKTTKRRSLGGPPCRRRSQMHARRILNDKENLHFMAGNTPCHPPKDLLTALRKFENSPLKDVSNLTPKPTKTFNVYQETEATPKNQSSSHPKRRRILLDSPLEDLVNNIETSTSSQISEPLDLRETLDRDHKSVIHGATLPTVEIEYSPCVNQKSDDVCTLPIIGSRVFIKNPLYFTAEEVKEPKKTMTNFSMLLNKMSPMSALKFNSAHRFKICSEVSPLAKKMASLCFNKAISSPEEASMEMETKLLNRQVDESSDSKMGNETLERMIDDILKSTKKVRNARIKEKRSISEEREIIPERTFILYDSLNEREVKTPEIRGRKRCSSESTPIHTALPEGDFNLKRQRCVRRKRSKIESAPPVKPPPPATPPSTHPFYLDDHNQCRSSNMLLTQSTNYPELGIPNVSNSSWMLGQYSSEKKNSMFGLTLESGIPSPSSIFNNLGLDSGFCMSSPISNEVNDSIDVISEPATPVGDFRSSRRCLTYSPDYGNYSDDKRSRKSQRGEVELEVQYREQIKVHIVRCRDLQRHNGSNKHINAYVKVRVNGVGIYQRTPVRRDSCEPYFAHTMVFPVVEGGEKVLQVSVWHRDRQKRRSEFLGCISLALSHAAKRELGGSWSLQSREGSVRREAGAAPPRIVPPTDLLNAGMAAESFPKEGDDCSNETNNRLAAQQREADEHLFLRYLELDPLDGPDAGPAAVQRKASGNKAGRTPFTTTRRLVRTSDQGFGFSVVWTRPPRVERVEAGRAAERAGLLPGDYIVFVDRSNVVTMPESQVLNLIRSSGTQLLLETFRRPGGSHVATSHARGSIGSHVTISEAPCSPRTLPLTGTGTTTQRNRRPVALPHLAFTRESVTGGGSAAGVTINSGAEHVRALHAVVLREQQYSTWMQFGMERYVMPLSSRNDVISPSEHKLLFQNCEELLRLSEDILEQIVLEDGEIQFHLIASVYLSRLPNIVSLYKSYCNGLKRADCVLVQRSRQQGGNFVKLCTEPPIPRKRPDVTQFVHKPLEQFRELLRLLRAARLSVPATHPDFSALSKLVSDLQNAYHEITAGAGLMGPLGEGRPLLSVSDLESRLVFTRCKPFTLSKPGRQWIFGGDLARVEGRTVRPYWALLFTDLLLFATVSRDRVLFITEEPLPIANISETCFNVRKKANEFRLAVGAGRANSPTARCGPPVRTRARTMVLRAPSSDLKAVWQSLLLRQICRMNSSSGTPLSSPMESPAPLACYSEMTLDSQQRQVAANLPEVIEEEGTRSSRLACKGAAIHLAKWMKTHPGNGTVPPEPEPEVWSAEQLRKRSKELKLLDVEQVSKASIGTQITIEKSPSEQERSPSRSTNSDSQITVRSSPVVPETVAVCRQCHKRCFSKPTSPLVTTSTKAVDTVDKTNNNISNQLSPNNNTEVKCCADKCTNNNVRAEITPEKKNALRAISEIRSSLIKSRENFFKTSESKESCSSPLNRSSPKSPCSQKSDSSHSTLYSTNSPLSYAHTTCSSIAMSNSTGKSPGRDSLASGSSGNDDIVQCVIAQEKYLNEVKCVENVTLSKGSPLRFRSREPSKIRMGKTIVERNSSASKSLNKCIASELPKNNLSNCSGDYLSRTTRVNGDVKSSGDGRCPDLSWGPLMLMGLTAMNPAAQLIQQMEVSSRQPAVMNSPPKIVPNISVVPPTPDFKNETKILLPQNTLEDSPDDSPLAEEPPYLALKRYGTMSSLERLPSDELDDNQLGVLTEPLEKETETAQGFLGWTTRAGNYVAEKMALLNSLAEAGAASTGASFLERYLGAGEWKSVRGVTGIENEAGEGSGASGEEAWGTPSSGDLSDNAFPDSDHATLSVNLFNSPTKSSSSCAGDEDTELMMDELLMTPPISGPSLRPLLPRRRLEPLMEEEGSDASSTSSADAASEITPSPTDQGSGADGGVADPRPPAPHQGLPPSPDRTPTNPKPPPGLLGPALLQLLSGSPDHGSDGRSTTSSSTLEGCRSAPDGSEDSGSYESGLIGVDHAGGDGDAFGGAGDRLSPRMEMRLALQEGTDILAEQEQRWDQMSGRCGWVRRPLNLPSRPRPSVGRTSIISNNSASAPAGQAKMSAMERLALLEARGARRGTRRPRPTTRLMGLVRRRASSDSPERRPYSPRRQQQHEKQLDKRFWKQLRRRSSGTLPNIQS